MKKPTLNYTVIIAGLFLCWAREASAYRCGTLAIGQCGRGNLGVLMALNNPDPSVSYRVTVRVGWQRGAETGQNDKVYTVPAGGRVTLGCTKGPEVGLGQYPTDYSYIIVGESGGSSSRSSGSSSGSYSPPTLAYSTGGDGGHGESNFNAPPGSNIKRLKQIVVHSGNTVYRISLWWETNDGKMVASGIHGGPDGSETIIDLEEGEFLETVKGRSGKYIDQIQFVTTKGNRYGPYGGNGGGEFEINAPCKDGHILGIFGHSDSYRLHNVGFYYSCPRSSSMSKGIVTKR